MKVSKKVLIASVAIVAASPSFAESTTEAINAAVTSGQASVQVVVAGVIGLAALGFGVGMIISYLRR